MNNYVENLWQGHALQGAHTGKPARILGWAVGVIAGISLAAYLSRDYWYPYVAPYLYY
jgi:hypothetical protein